MEWIESPIYLQIVQKIKNDILCGIYHPGMRLPSIRQLSKSVGVNQNTMQRAISCLKQESFLIKRSNEGFFVTLDTAFLEKVKLDTATYLLNNFLNSMYKIGYNDAMICSMITALQNS